MRLWILHILAAALTYACSCAMSPTGNPPCQSVWQHQAVFTGIVTAVDNPGMPVYQPGMPPLTPDNFPKQKIYLRVTRALTGLPPETKDILIETGLGGGDCGYRFERDVEYIVYAYGSRNGRLSTGICSPTRPVKDAAEDLEYFQQLAGAKPGCEIRVLAYDPRAPRSGPRASPAGLAGAQIDISGNGQQKSAKTDASGRVVFGGMPAGEYRVDTTLPGYTTPFELRPVKLHDKGCAEVGVPLQLDRFVTGRVVTRDGVPAAGILVEAVRSRPLHENELPTSADSAETDSFGQYKLRNLGAGDYYVGVSLSRSPRVEAPFTRWFFPGTEDPVAATLVHITEEPGGRTIDLRLPPRQNERKIQGLVLWPDGTPASAAQVILRDPRYPWDLITATTTDATGSFSVSVLDATRYRLEVLARRGTDVLTVNAALVEPGAVPASVRLVLSVKGAPKPSDDEALKSWRSGQGLR